MKINANNLNPDSYNNSNTPKKIDPYALPVQPSDRKITQHEFIHILRTDHTDENAMNLARISLIGIRQLGLLNSPFPGSTCTPLFIATVYPISGFYADETEKALYFIDYILRLGADVTQRLPHYDNNTHLLSTISNACNGAAMLIIQHTPQNSPSLDATAEHLYAHSGTALHLAVAKGYTTRSFQGQNLKYSNLEIAEAILNKGGNPNIPNGAGNTPLHLACARRDYKMIELLLNKSDRDLKNHEGKTAEDLLENSFQESFDLIGKITGGAFLLNPELHAEQYDRCKTLFREKQPR